MKSETYPQFSFRLPEANVQAEFYHQARLVGMVCVLEFMSPAGRLDLVVLNDEADRLLCIVECKRETRRSDFDQSAQVARYRQLGVPVLCLMMRDESASLVKRIMKEFVSNPEHTGVKLSDLNKIPKITRGQSRRFSRDALWAEQ